MRKCDCYSKWNKKMPADIIVQDFYDRVEGLFNGGWINEEQKQKALAIREMWIKPLTRTPEFSRWVRAEDKKVVDGKHLNPTRMQIVIDFIIQDRSITQIEQSLRMPHDTALKHLKDAIDSFPMINLDLQEFQGS